MGFMAGVNIIAGTGLMMDSSLWGTIERELKLNSNQIGEVIKVMVEDKTPILSGSLQSDIVYSSTETPGSVTLGSEDLVYIYAEGTAQEAYWNRIYVPYVEGGLLGLPTYTNDPRLIFASTAEGDGLDATTLWAQIHVDEAVAMWEVGAGVITSVGQLPF